MSQCDDTQTVERILNSGGQLEKKAYLVLGTIRLRKLA